VRIQPIAAGCTFQALKSGKHRQKRAPLASGGCRKNVINLRQAAELLGYSESGLRKLIARGDIRYFQVRPHAPIKFRQEWLDEFIDRGTKPSEPETRTRTTKPKPPTVGSFGFDPALLEL
jgi:hypothetical protein